MTKSDENIIPLPTMEEIEAEAAAWLTVLGREEVAESDLAKLKAWLRRSDRHRQAFEALSALSGDLEILQELNDIAEAVMDSVPPARPVWRRRGFLAAASASLGAIVLVAGAVFVDWTGPAEQQGAFATLVGEQETVTLLDGSSVQLNTDSRIEVDITRDLRIVRLLQGEAHFDVAKEKDRPFVVYAAGGRVEAVGTAFTVRLKPDDAVEVTVAEGRVALASLVTNGVVRSGPSPSGSGQSIGELTAGQSAVFNRRIEQLAQMEPDELNLKLAWRQGLLAYAGDPLEDVIADISRYTNITIEISDPDLRAMPIGGYFRVGEMDALFDSLELTFGLTVERVSDTYIKLSSAS